ncbi:MAG: hypothetical protein DYH08_02055 [Actinobacteria bacterium ATB1]|nr:hypothetical protein [Actinobacteria bacterium ATB1]
MRTGGFVMFVQIIQGRVANGEGLLSQLDQWLEKLAPGAVGWLGSTGGVTDDGHAILLARFESAAAAKANSERPEQDAWWAATAACFDGDPDFHESEDVETLFDGGSDDAGFVQVMQGATSRRADLARMEKEFEPILREIHTGLIGSVRCWYGNGEFTEAAYFTDEAAARAGEKAMGERSDLESEIAQWEDVMTDVAYFDLRRPHLASA